MAAVAVVAAAGGSQPSKKQKQKQKQKQKARAAAAADTTAVEVAAAPAAAPVAWWMLQEAPAAAPATPWQPAAAASDEASAAAAEEAGAAKLSTVHLFWDLDNMSPGRASKAPSLVYRLQRAVRELLDTEGQEPGLEPEACFRLTACANLQTLKNLGGASEMERVLALCGGQLVATPVER